MRAQNKTLVFLLLLLLCCLPSIVFADVAVYGDTTYIFSESQSIQYDDSEAKLTIGMQYESVDLSTFEMRHDAAPEEGAVFGVYAKGPGGAFVPFPDPSNPLRALMVTVKDEPVSVQVPSGVDLYILQESVPQGYSAGTLEDTHQPITLDEPMLMTNYAKGTQGLRLHLVGNDVDGKKPLEGVRFTMEGMGSSHSLVTDENGVILLPDVTPGLYTLWQDSALSGFHAQEQDIPVEIIENRVTALELYNDRGGSVTVYPTGITIARDLEEIGVPLERRIYEIFDENETSKGILSYGQSMDLPATADGVVYTLRQRGETTDDFPIDSATHTFVLHSGEALEQEPSVQTNHGLFRLAVTTEDEHKPVGGGLFTLYDESEAAIATFKTEEDGSPYIPRTPLKPGVYTMRMASAPNGCMYTDNASVRFQIRPYLTEERPISEISMEVVPIPKALQSPTVAATSQQMPSLFDESIQLDFQLSLAGSNGHTLPIADLTYDIDLPRDPAITLVREYSDGARIDIARRLALPGIEEVENLTITGTVHFTFTYLSAPNTFTDVQVASPFAVEVASFETKQDLPNYAVYGHVRGDKGEIMPGIPVKLENESGDVFAELKTDPYGAYAFTAEAIQAAGDAKVRFYPQVGYGALLDKNGDAVIMPEETRFGRIVLHDFEASYDEFYVSYGSVLAQKAETDGRFVLTGVFGDKDRVAVDGPESVAVQVEREDDEIVLNLYKGASISGHIADVDNAVELSDVLVTLACGDDIYEEKTDETGAFSFDRLLAGDYSVQVAAPEGYLPMKQEADASITLTAGQSFSMDTVNLRKPVALEGKLYASGAPLADVEIALSPTSQTVKTSADGTFAFEALEQGTYSISAKLPDDQVLSTILAPVTLSKSGERAFLTLEAVQPARIAGHLWNDEDDDGAMGSGEPPLIGANVSLLSDAGDVLDTVQSDGSGDFVFEGVSPGSYRVSIKLPRGMIFARVGDGTPRLIAGLDENEGTSAPFDVSAGATIEDLTCGATISGAVSGLVWDDHNGDGYFDDNEPAMEGVSIALTKDGNKVGSTVTDENGVYTLEGLRTGDYSLTVAFPEGCLFTAQGNGSDKVGSTFPTTDQNTATMDISISTLRPEVVVNAGALRAAAIVTRVWLDADADGDDWNENGFEGMQVELYGRGGSVLVDTQTTGADGRASFTSLRPGEYSLLYKLPDATYGFTAGGLVTSQKGFGQSGTITIGDAGEHATEDVGIAQLGSVQGIVFADQSYDGIRTDEDKGIPAVQVDLLDESREVVQTVQTDGEGMYAFEGVMPGNYTAVFTLPSGYTFTINREDAPTYNSDVPQVPGNVGETSPFYLPMGETIPLDAGGYRAGSISGMVWHDAQGNGMYMNGNTPLTGIVVELLRDERVHLSVETEADGTYSFDGLPPGTYAVRMTLPEGMYFSERQSSSGRGNTILPTQGNVGRTAPITLLMNTQEKAVDAGVVYTGSITGRAYNVIDDTPLEDVTIRLVRADEPDLEAISDKDGRYRIEGVRAGSGELHITPPEGWLLDEHQLDIVPIEIPQNQLLEDMDIQLLRETVIEGVIWLDANDNRVLDEGEGFVEAAVVALLKHDDYDEATGEVAEEPRKDEKESIQASGLDGEEGYVDVDEEEEEEEIDNMIAITGTDSEGKFYFDKLLPGYYSIHTVPPGGVLLYSSAESPIEKLEVGETIGVSIRAYKPAYIRGMVWEDDNSDGLYTSDERLLEGVQVSLRDLDGNTLLTTTTDSEGNYLFNELPPMTCEVRVKLPDGYVFARPVDGGSTILQTNGSQEASTAPITLTMGERVDNMNAGGMRTGRIGDYVWLDENGNGLQDTDEPPIEGMQISLWRVLNGGSLEFVTEVRTDAYGHYRFEDLRPGYYQLSFTMDDYLPTRPMEELDLINSKLPWIARQSLSTEPFLLRSGQDLVNMDAGVVTKEIAEALGWVVADDNTISAP